ncbi:MAG: RNA-binding transcriptional accessory protein [Anaerolineae bacterium]|nr:RNA-binding transcriptional accessory protein [Anaerolineae bacterium]
MTNQLIAVITAELALRIDQVAGAVELLDAGNTIPFIARYRKEATGGLDEVQLRQIETRLAYLRNLSERKQAVLASIEEQGKLTPELRSAIEAADTLQKVEDLYLPYRPRRRTRATIARERGLEPLAERMLEQGAAVDIDRLAGGFLNAEVATVDDALAGARDIIAEHVSEDAISREIARRETQRDGMVLVRLAKKGADPGNKYEMYHEFRAPVADLPPHQLLAINRGETEGVLKVSLDAPDDLIVGQIENRVLTNPRSPFAAHVRAAVEDGYSRLIAPSIERETRGGLTEVSDDHAIHVFATNLKALLMQPPIRGKVVMGIDPGFRTGCKVAVVDGTGKYLASFTIYPHEPQRERQRSKDLLLAAVQRFGVEILAVGNGTASRETEQLAAEVIGDWEGGEGRKGKEGKEGKEGKKGKRLAYVMVSEAGASVYSASGLARDEFPDLDVSMRGAVSIARRLQDPLAELVKIDPKSIGVGLYQHDVDQKKLAGTLDAVVEDAVNAVGVDANTASPALLKYVAGVGPKLAQNIVAWRDENGPFQKRSDLLKVKGLGPKAYQQAAGFLRVPESRNPLDRTTVHPESYAVAENLLSLADLNWRMVDLSARLRQFRSRSDLQALAELLDVGVPTLNDIFEALLRPGRDPRDDLPAPVLRHDVLSLDDLSEGMVLTGTVRNVVDFGAFVDIGVKHDGLVHVSQMADRYVRNPYEVVSVGDVVQVKVVKIDRERGRIGLSMRLGVSV